MKGQYQDNRVVAIKNLSLICFILIGSFFGLYIICQTFNYEIFLQLNHSNN